MNDIERLLDAAAKSLISGDAVGALGHLEEALNIAESLPGPVEKCIQGRLERLSDLAQSALQGVSDAREYISRAAEDAKYINSYDSSGNPRSVGRRTSPLGKY